MRKKNSKNHRNFANIFIYNYRKNSQKPKKICNTYGKYLSSSQKPSDVLVQITFKEVGSFEKTLSQLYLTLLR